MHVCACVCALCVYVCMSARVCMYALCACVCALCVHVWNAKPSKIRHFDFDMTIL